MNYRNAELKDASRLDELLTKLIIDEKENYDNSIELVEVKDFYKNYVDKDNYMIYLCEDNHVIVGYIYAFIDDKDNAYIDALYVEEDYRKKGIALELVNLIKTWFKDKNINSVEIKVLSNNKAAKRLYEKTNFTTYKEIMKIKL